MSLSLHKQLYPNGWSTEVNGPLESNPSEAMQKAGNSSVHTKKLPGKIGSFRTYFLHAHLFSDVTFKAQSKLKQLGGGERKRKKRSCTGIDQRYIQLPWII